MALGPNCKTPSGPSAGPWQCRVTVTAGPCLGWRSPRSGANEETATDIIALALVAVRSQRGECHGSFSALLENLRHSLGKSFIWHVRLPDGGQHRPHRALRYAKLPAHLSELFVRTFHCRADQVPHLLRSEAHPDVRDVDVSGYDVPEVDPSARQALLLSFGSLGSLVFRLPEGYSDRSSHWTGVRSFNGRSRRRSRHRPVGSERWRGRALSAYGEGDDFNNNVSRTPWVFHLQDHHMSVE
jgi:hypothetical protein